MIDSAFAGIELISVMMSATARMKSGLTLPKMPARSIRVTSGPRSEITGRGAVTKSTIGWIGCVTVWIWLSTGPMKSLMKLPRSSATLWNSTFCRPLVITSLKEMMSLNSFGSGLPSMSRSTPASSCHSRKKSLSMVGKTPAAPPTRSSLRPSVSSSSAAASATMPASSPMRPSSLKARRSPSAVPSSAFRSTTSTVKLAESTELPRCRSSIMVGSLGSGSLAVTSASLAWSCRNASWPVTATSGMVTAMLNSSSELSAMLKKKPSSKLIPKPRSSCQSSAKLTAPSVSSPRPGMPRSKPMSTGRSSRFWPSVKSHWTKVSLISPVSSVAGSSRMTSPNWKAGPVIPSRLSVASPTETSSVRVSVATSVITTSVGSPSIV